MRVVLPIACETSPRTFRSRTSTDLVWFVTISAVTTVPSGMSTAATTVGRLTARSGSRPERPGVPVGPMNEQHDDERQCGQEDAEQKDEPTGSSHELNPPRCELSPVTGGTTLAWAGAGRLYEWARTTGKTWEDLARGARSLARWQPCLRQASRDRGADGDVQTTRPPGHWLGGLVQLRTSSKESVLDGLPDGAEDARHLGAEEDQRDDRDDRDEREDQRVLRETLALLVTTNEIDESGKELHWV